MMPTENFRRIHLDYIYPMFLERVLDTIAACKARGVEYIATQGFRTYGEQMQLWAQGRTQPGKIVTQAKGGESAHNFGLAIDFVRDTDLKMLGVQPGWSSGDFAVLIEEAEKRGLHSGRGYRDYPHISWPGYVTKDDLLPLAEKAKQVKGFDALEKLKQVWSIVRIPS
jgi:peptidoglycan L-alanyl-D-glutamate endopeptidase CwlK